MNNGIDADQFCNHHTNTRLCHYHNRHRPAISGMIESLILIGIAVTGCALLAAWFGGYVDGGGGGSALTDIGERHCTLRVHAANGVGMTPDGKPLNYVEAVLTNTGTADINHTVEIWIGSEHHYTNNTMTTSRPLGPGQHITYYHTGVKSAGLLENNSDKGAGIGYMAAIATYADGNQITCDQTWSLASFVVSDGGH